MSATHPIDFTTTSAPVLYVAFELGWTSWKLAFTVGAAKAQRKTRCHEKLGVTKNSVSDEFSLPFDRSDLPVNKNSVSDQFSLPFDRSRPTR